MLRLDRFMTPAQLVSPPIADPAGAKDGFSHEADCNGPWGCRHPWLGARALLLLNDRNQFVFEARDLLHA